MENHRPEYQYKPPSLPRGKQIEKLTHHHTHAGPTSPSHVAFYADIRSAAIKKEGRRL